MASLALLLLAPLALAQTTTVQVPLFGFDEQSIDASVVGVTSQLTTFSLACSPGADSNDCGIAPTHLLTYGPSKYIMSFGESTDFAAVQDCAITATTSVPGKPAVTAFCTESFGGAEANFPGTNTTTYTDGTFAPLRVTAGASLLIAQTGAGVTTGSPGSTASNTGSTSPGATASNTGSTSRPTTGTLMGSLTGSAAAPTNTNAAPALGVEVLGGLFGVAAGVAGLLYI
jgi:hypothetical protein